MKSSLITRYIKLTKKFFATTWGKTLIITLLWQAVLTMAGLFFDHALGSRAVTDITPLSHTSIWDAGWYLGILEGSYWNNPAAPVFYPLFPFLVRIVMVLSFGVIGPLEAGFIVNTLAIWCAITALFKISYYYLKKTTSRWLVIALFLSSPVAFFMHVFYAEAVFCAVGFWAFLFALKRNWFCMGTMLAIATASRLPSLLFIGLCGLEFFRSNDWKIKKVLNIQLLYFLLAPIGFLAFGIALYFIRGDFFAMFHGYDATSNWQYHTFNPNIVQTIGRDAWHTISILRGAATLNTSSFVNSMLPVFALGLLSLTSLYALTKKQLRPLGIFGFVTLVFYTLNNNLVSVHRYLLPCISIYIVVAYLYEKFPSLKPLIFALLYLAIILQTFLYTLYINIQFAG